MVEQYYTLSRKRVFKDEKGYTGMTICWQHTWDPLNIKRKLSSCLTIDDDKNKINGWQSNVIGCSQDWQGPTWWEVWTIDYALQESTI
jgi:hypothetical protein